MRAQPLALALAVSLTLLADAAQAQSRAQFCNRWHNVCLTTCPGGASASCTATCEDRRDQCRKNGCYFFRTPGPRCEGEGR